MQSEVLVVVIISISRRFGETSLKFIPDYMTTYSRGRAPSHRLHCSDSPVHVHGNNSFFNVLLTVHRDISV